LVLSIPLFCAFFFFNYTPTTEIYTLSLTTLFRSVAFLDEGRLLFEESMSDLVARFREVHVTLERNGSQNRDELVAAPFPKCWLRVRSVGNVLSFVDTQFSEGNVGERLRALVGNVRTVDAQPMALRSIFTTLARAAREGALP